MTRFDKLIQKMRETPHKIRFAEAESLLFREGFVRFNQRGSHITFRHGDGRLLTVVRPHGREAYMWPHTVLKILEALDL